MEGALLLTQDLVYITGWGKDDLESSETFGFEAVLEELSEVLQVSFH